MHLQCSAPPPTFAGRLAVFVGLLFFVLALGPGAQASGEVDVSAFVGAYTGEATLTAADGTIQHRNMAVEISETKHGFSVSWTTVTHKPDGRTKEKSYSIDFRPTDRGGIFAAAMRKNMFGQEVQMDPMKGEPYVWARIVGDTLTVNSLFVDDVGGYEMQQFDRTLAEGGLMLEFSNFRNGEMQRAISTFLERE